MNTNQPKERSSIIPGIMGQLCPGGIALGLEAADKEEALGQMVNLALKIEPRMERRLLLDALTAREAIVTTGIGRGMAIPHADLPTVPEALLCLGIFPEGVDFQSLDQEPVCVVFLLLGTGREPNAHMRLLSDIARLSKEPRLLPRLLTAPNEAAVCDYLQEIADKKGL